VAILHGKGSSKYIINLKSGKGVWTSLSKNKGKKKRRKTNTPQMERLQQSESHSDSEKGKRNSIRGKEPTGLNNGTEK